ncbi:temptin [Plakobranchus ocellatus]|uniref:Temptin n=1 Tax=Plakobranchus ocellatus TaxID=259542 RepID=A0AAV3YFN7_9GAST|nr:temptin [Plakobranchus ocellatus]
MILSFVCISGLLLLTTHGFPYFQHFIPNGFDVPNPCMPDEVWPGVGHVNLQGGAARNLFGLAFKSYGYQWTEDLCQEDSDNDTLTNGQELGDPNCIWTEGDIPEGNATSHPVSKLHHLLEQTRLFLSCLSDCTMQIYKERYSVRGTVHQGMPAFTAPGRQCMFNVLANAIANEKLSVEAWSRKLDVNRILKVGDWLCVNSGIQEAFPIVDDLERPVWVDGVNYKINLQEPFFGSQTIRVRPYAFIEEALKEGHEEHHFNYRLLYSRLRDVPYEKDCHSKVEKGMPVPESTAIITKHTASAYVEIFLTELANSLKTAIFLNSRKVFPIK